MTLGRSKLWVAVSTVAFAMTGCGAETLDGSRSVANSWVRALDEERWQDACGFEATPGANCARGNRRSYSGRTLRLLPAGAYGNGRNFTDNVTRFAFSARSGSQGTDLTYFEVAGQGNEEKVSVIVQFLK